MRTINTMKKNKFHVGSSVYLVYNINEKYHVHEDVFEVGRVSQDDKGFHYSLRNRYDDPIDWCYEDVVFSTRKDAKLEAERLNSLSEANNE